MILIIAFSDNLTIGQNSVKSELNGGTQNYLPKYNRISVLGVDYINNSAIYQNATNYIGIGTGTTVNRLLQIHNTSANNHLLITGTAPAIAFSNVQTGNELVTFGLATSNSNFVQTSAANDFIFRTINNSTGNFIFAIGTTSTPTEIMRITSGGNVGIGITTPATKFEVDGTSGNTLKIVDGNQGAGKILTSNATGVASWTTPNSNTYAWTLTGNTGTSISNYIGTYDAISLRFRTSNAQRMIIDSSGYVGIGATKPVARLDIRGSANTDPAIIVRNQYDTIHFRVRTNGYVEARDVLVKTGQIMPDYVFEKDYKYRSLEQLEEFINTNKHLPDVPSAADVKNGGLNVVEMDAALLRKVEEQTLYIIDLQKQITAMQKEIELLKSK